MGDNVMDINEFGQTARKLADEWADYFTNLEELPVKFRVKPGEILGRFPQQYPAPGYGRENRRKLPVDRGIIPCCPGN